MNDDLLALYHSELSYFRRMYEEFALQHPKIAGRLRFEKQGEDPHVSRLVESFAFLNARLRLKLEDEFPELCHAFLNILYPEYLNPIPSCSIVSLSLPRSQFGMKDGYRLKKHTEINSAPIDGEPCRFRTAYPVHLWPIEVEHAEVQTPPFTAPPNSLADHSKGLVRIQLKTYSPDVPFSALSLDKLRFYLDGDSRFVLDLYELLMHNVTGVVVAATDSEVDPEILTSSVISPVGFQIEDALLDYSSRSRLGFHLLTEFCAFPKKFMFFDVVLKGSTLASLGDSDRLNLYIYLDEIQRNLENNIPPSTFQLGGTPIVNLFRQRAEPILIKQTKSEFRVVPDARRALANEVYSIEEVVAHSDSGDFNIAPFYSANHSTHDDREDVFWYSNRRPVELGPVGKERNQDHGTDVFISLLGLNGRMIDAPFRSLDVYLTCLNRNYPNELPRDAKLSLSGGDAMVETKCLWHPTETKRPPVSDQTYWRLISHLALNHLSLTDGDEGAGSLREMLRLYNFSNDRGVNNMIDGLVGSSTRRMVGRVGGSVSAGFCKGTEIRLVLDEARFSGGGEYLFGAVLDRFLAMYTSINSFTKTIVETRQGKKFDKWPLRTGDSELI